MNREQYLGIRKKLDLSMKPWALFTHYCREFVFVSSVLLTWNLFSTTPLKFLAVPLLACVIFRNFSLMHDAVHKAVSKNQFVNDFCGIFAGAICLLPFEQWRRSHLDHHTWSGNLDRDPVTAFITVFPKLPLQTQKILSFFWKTWFPLLAIVQYSVFWILAAKITLQHRTSFKLVLSSLSPFLFWGSIGAIVPISFSVQVILPAILIYMVAVEAVNFPHHLQLPQYGGDVRFPFWEQYKISRSCIYPKWFAEWVVLNFNYHTEHHLYPDVPWYHLSKLQPEVAAALGTEYNTDPQFRWILENKPKALIDVIHYRQTNSNIEMDKAS